MSNTQSKAGCSIPIWTRRNNGKIPCNETRFFFDKVNNKQFHPKFSGCDDFSVRLQIRKHPSISWSRVAYALATQDWLACFITKGVSCRDRAGNKLVSSFRSRPLDHQKCLMNTKEYKKAMAFYKKTGKKSGVIPWAKKCLLRGEKNA